MWFLVLGLSCRVAWQPFFFVMCRSFVSWVKTFVPSKVQNLKLV
nr:MAG TPA: hypothetical protein [Caudoviricetes sp.]